MAKYGVFLKPTTLDRMVVVKTTVASPADSDWASQDGEVDFGLKAVKSLWYVEVSGGIYIGTQQEDGRVAYSLFATGTDTWTIKNEKVALAGDTNFDNAPADEAVSLALRSDGDVVLCAAYNDGTRERLRVFTRESGSWTNRGEASSGIAAETSGVSVADPDSSDRISWAYKEQTNDTILRSISSANAISATTSIDTSSDSATFITAPGVIDTSDIIYIPYINTDNKIRLAKWTSGATPTVSSLGSGALTVEGQSATVIPFVVACLAIDGTNVLLLYANDADQDLYYNDDADGSPDNIEELDAVTITRISCKKGTSDLLYFYDDAGTTKFGAITLGAAGLSPAEIITMLNRDKISPIRQM